MSEEQTSEMTSQCFEAEPHHASVAATVLAQAKNNVLWMMIEKETGVHLPLYLRVLLHFFGFETAASMKHFNENLFNEMENFARTELSEYLNEHDQKINYLGIFATNPSKFHILPGHKACVMEIHHYVNSKGIFHFIPPQLSPSVSPNSTYEWQREEASFLARTSHSEQRENSTHYPNTSFTDTKTLKYHDELYCVLKNWYLSQVDGVNIFEQFLESPKDRYISIFKREGYQNDEAFAAKIRCCLCPAEILAGRYGYGKKDTESRPTRWVYRNFIKHVVKQHFNKYSAAGSDLISHHSDDASSYSQSIKRSLSTSDDENNPSVVCSEDIKLDVNTDGTITATSIGYSKNFLN